MSQRDIDDVKFAIAEVERFARMSPEETFDYLDSHRGDAWATLDVPGGHIFYGDAARQRLHYLITRHVAAAHAAAQDDFEPNRLLDEVERTFVRFFLHEQRPPDQTNVARMLSASVKAARRAHVALTHYVPCILSREVRPATFAVGPVVFRGSNEFLKDLEPSLSQYRQRISTQSADSEGVGDDPAAESARAWAESLSQRATQFYAAHPWIATVSVPPVDMHVSRARAVAAVDAALDVLRLFFPDPTGVYLRQGEADQIVGRAARITSDESREIHIETIGRTIHAPPWLPEILSVDASFIERVGKWLQHHVKTGEIAQTQRRYLDALHWYGQAIADPAPASRIVKLLAAAERLTIARKTDEVAQRVIRRIALLTQGHDGKDFARVKQDVKEMYEWRSSLMHGSASPFDRRVLAAANIATALIRWCMFTAFAFFEILLNDAKRSDDDLEMAYEAWTEEESDPAAG